jgi:hypothetical protein
VTDWERVEKLRSKGETWSDIAADEKVGFQAPDGTDPGRAIKSLYLTRKSRGRTGRRAERRSRGDTGKVESEHPRRSLAIGIIAIVIVVGLITGYLVFYHPSPPSSDLIAYCGGEGQSAHYHILLVIDVNGVQQHLPYDQSQSADIGFLASPAFTNPSLYCSNGGLHALHTHDGSGIIHAELPPAITTAGITPTLGDFFTIWGQNLSSTHVWIYPGHLHATMLDSDTGARTDFSSNPGSVPLYQSPQGPVANPFPIPPGLIFNSQYGNGASGGTFAGEIIWLNVTSGA